MTFPADCLPSTIFLAFAWLDNTAKGHPASVRYRTQAGRVDRLLVPD
jgi:hypothetical protein